MFSAEVDTFILVPAFDRKQIQFVSFRSKELNDSNKLSRDKNLIMRCLKYLLLLAGFLRAKFSEILWV